MELLDVVGTGDGKRPGGGTIHPYGSLSRAACAHIIRDVVISFSACVSSRHFYVLLRQCYIERYYYDRLTPSPPTDLNGTCDCQLVFIYVVSGSATMTST